MFEDVTVFVVDDDEQARDSVSALVRSMGLSAEVYSSAEEFLANQDSQRDGCLITDVRMLGMNGLELQAALKERGIALPVVIITAFARTTLTVTAMKQGAVTVLEKPYEDDDLWDAVREALAKDASERRRRRRLSQICQRIETLTDRERETMELVVAGKPNKVIARALDVSIRTVENRRHHVFEKMKVDSVAELVQVVMSVREDKVRMA